MKEICDALERGGVDALRALLDAQPSLVQTTDRLGDLPLHVACSYRFETIEALHSLPVLELFVERYPQALQTRNGHGMLPLHLSCWFGSEAQIRAIAAWYPGGLAEVDDNGYQPITFVIAKLVMEGRPWEEYQDLLTFLLGMCPESLWNMDHQGVLALQSACFDNDGSDAQPIPTGRQLLELYCRLTNTPHQRGLHRIVDVPNQRVPLHVAIASQTRLEVAQMIYEADPTAIRLTDRQGRLPLHHVMSQPFASRQMRSLREKLTWLLQVDPSAVAHYDHDGKTPLHLLLENESLVVRPNEGVATNNNNQNTRSTTTTTHDSILSSSLLVPGDDLLYSPDSTALLKLLLTPRNATSQRDRNEWVLFAVRAVLNACNNHNNNNTTPIITNPCALPDLQHGNLPLHLAVQFHRHERSAPGLVEGLLQHFPGAILHANHKGQTALQLVLASSKSSSSTTATSPNSNNNNPCCSLDTIFTLVNNNPTSVL